MVIAAALMVSCGQEGAPPNHAAAEKYSLTNPDGTIGTITSGGVCDGMLVLADVEGRIYRLSLPAGDALAPFNTPDLQPMAIAADCAQQRLWIVSPARPRGLRAVAIDAQSGRRVADVPIDDRCFVTSATMAGDELIAAGDCLVDPNDDDLPPGASYYEHRRNGFRLDTATGQVRAGPPPYEPVCIGAGACVGGSVALRSEALYAVLPTATKVGVYSRDGELQRTFDVRSPQFKRDGDILPMSTASEPRVRWSARNSLLYRVFPMRNGFVVIHHLTELPSNWTMSSMQRPQFKAWANVYSNDGTAIRLDVPLGELPMAFDGNALFVVDYGVNGRQGAHEQVGVVRIPVVD